ncbi:unnamed protein product [Schistosoma curassoni]|uniref:Ovule protein n=1 Tax=Schistosoma curassoni TaxID=6186 RepID=A0A183KM38_9TREM|nr:unnamed protein product [Schistosoma curassoni]
MHLHLVKPLMKWQNMLYHKTVFKEMNNMMFYVLFCLLNVGIQKLKVIYLMRLNSTSIGQCFVNIISDQRSIRN